MKLQQDAMLAEAGDEDEFGQVLRRHHWNDITGKELPWQAAKHSRVQELKYLRELCVCEEVDECGTVAKYNITPVDTKWSTLTKHSRKPMQIRSRIVAREIRRGDRPDLYTPRWKL